MTTKDRRQNGGGARPSPSGSASPSSSSSSSSAASSSRSSSLSSSSSSSAGSENSGERKNTKRWGRVVIRSQRQQRSCVGWKVPMDILDDAVTAGLSLSPNTYEALLTAYHEREMLKEADALIRQMRKTRLVLDCHDKLVPSSCPSQASSTAAISNLYEVLVHEMREVEKALPSTICELNSSIYFFCKAKMMYDASNTYRRMQEMKVQPTGQTFVYLAQCYSALGRIRDVTILWGDMKRNIPSGYLSVGKDVYELFLLHFIKGGYFERVMEVISFMGDRNMFVDKLMVRNEFLKLHKNLYQNLKDSDVRTEARRKRVGYIRLFREWAGID